MELVLACYYIAYALLASANVAYTHLIAIATDLMATVAADKVWDYSMIESRYFMAKISKGQKQRQSSFGFLMQVIARRIDAEMKEELAKIDVDVKIFANLMMLSDQDGISQRELGRMLEFPDYYTSRNVDAMIEAQLAERRPDPNSRRSVLIYLTDKGRKKAAELPRVIQAVNASFLEPLSATEKKTVIQLLHKVGGIPTGGDPNL